MLLTPSDLEDDSSIDLQESPRRRSFFSSLKACSTSPTKMLQRLSLLGLMDEGRESLKSVLKGSLKHSSSTGSIKKTVRFQLPEETPPRWDDILQESFTLRAPELPQRQVSQEVQPLKLHQRARSADERLTLAPPVFPVRQVSREVAKR